MRPVSCLTVMSLCCVLVSIGVTQDKKPDAEVSPSAVQRAARDQEKRILHTMSNRITLEVTDSPLREVLQEISKLTDREILIDQRALADEGISLDQTVSLNLGEMTVQQVLFFLLQPLQLSWIANDGILEVTTIPKANERLITRVYDIRNLCKSLDPLIKDPSFRHRTRPRAQRGQTLDSLPPNTAPATGLFSVPSFSNVMSVFGQMGGMPFRPAARREMSINATGSVEALLAGLITDLSSMRWSETDGEGGDIQLGDGCLIVSQTFQGQLEIAGLLQALERFVEGKSQGKSVAARHVGYPANDDAAIFETLSKPRNLEVSDEELAIVLRSIGQDAHIRVLIDQPALSDEGISAEQNINLQISKLPLGICLKKMLDPLELTYVVEQGVLLVTTNAKANEMLSVRLYDISRCGKVAKDDAENGIITVLTQLTSGKWGRRDGEGGLASLITPNHLLVLQTQKIHSEIELLIEDLASDGPGKPTQPPLILKAYAVSDTQMATDLKLVLPKILTHWQDNGTSEVGTIHQVGTSLLVNQTSIVHDQIEEMMSVLEDSQRRRITQPTNLPPQPESAMR